MNATIREASRQIVRKPVAALRVTWTDPLLDESITVTTSGNNRVSYPDQVADLILDVPKRWASTNSGCRTNSNYFPAPSTALEAADWQMGWWGDGVGDAEGVFSAGQVVEVSFIPRAVIGYTVSGDSALMQYPVAFDVRVYNGATLLEQVEYPDNGSVTVSGSFAEVHAVADRIVLEVYKWSTPARVAKIAEFYGSVVSEYGGSEIMSMSVLRETEGAASTIPIGHISCNELSITLQNFDHSKYPMNKSSQLHTLIKRNRRMEPFIGFVYGGYRHFMPLGVYWSGDWNIGDRDGLAQVTARDRMELFRNIEYTGHIDDDDTPAEATYWENESLKTILDEVLTVLKIRMPDLAWSIDDELDDIIIPIGFFKRKSYFNVIRDIAVAGMAFAYIDQPTEAEIGGSPLIKDILRIVHVSNIFPEVGAVNLENEYVIRKMDYIGITQPPNTNEVINTINIKQKVFEIDEEEGVPKETDKFGYIVQDTDSISEYGEMKHDYPECDLLQSEEYVKEIAEAVITLYNKSGKNVEIMAFGDPTIEIGDRIAAPQYIAGGSGVMGLFAVKRTNLDFNKSLRVTYGGFKLAEVDV